MEGPKAEEYFIERCTKLGKEAIRSTQHEDMFEHIDFYVDGTSFDVKTEKRINRKDKHSSPDIIWLEMRNVRGNAGWLCSKVQKIAFLRGEEFYVVDRQKLLEFTREFVGFGVSSFKKKYKKLYTRKYKSDLLTYVYWNDIQHLLEEII